MKMFSIYISVRPFCDALHLLICKRSLNVLSAGDNGLGLKELAEHGSCTNSGQFPGFANTN